MSLVELSDERESADNVDGDDQKFLCTHFSEQARISQSAAMNLSLFVLALCLIVGSFTLGRILSRAKVERLRVLGQSLSSQIANTPELRQLNMEQFASLRDGGARWDQLSTVREFVEKRITDGSIATTEAAQKEAILEGGAVTLAELATDRKRIDSYRRKYGGETVAVFSEQKTPKSPFSFGGQPPPPITEVRDMALRYRVDRAILEPGGEQQSITPLLEGISKAVGKVEQDNKQVVDAYLALVKRDQKIRALPFGVLDYDPALFETYSSILADLEVFSPEQDLYVKEKQLPAPKATSFDAVSLQLLSRIKDRVQGADSGLVSGSIFDVEISFPLTYILITLPFLLPLYALLVANHVRRRMRLQRYADDWLSKIGPSTPSAIHFPSEDERNGVVRYFMSRSNWQLIAVQVLVVLAAAPLLLVAVSTPATAPELAALRSSPYLNGSLLVAIYAMGILVVCAAAYMISMRVPDN